MTTTRDDYTPWERRRGRLDGSAVDDGPVDVVDGLKRCFARLTAQQLERLRWHRQRGTPVICGELAEWYVHLGAGCPIALASVWRLPAANVADNPFGDPGVNDPPDDWCDVMEEFNGASDGLYWALLRRATAADVWAAIDEVPETTPRARHRAGPSRGPIEKRSTT